MSGTRKRVRDVLAEEGIESKHLKIYFTTKSKKQSENSVETEPSNMDKPIDKTLNEISFKSHKDSIKDSKESLQKQIDELNKKFDSMINLQTKLIALLEDIDYRFNDKGQMLSYIS
jgi:hypothetical protein